MESNQEKTEHETSIALITQDISYIKKDLTKMGMKLDATDIKLDAVLNHYIQRDEFMAKNDMLQSQIDKRIEGAHARIKELDEKKLDKEDFSPIKKIGMIIITAFVFALLALVGWKQ